MHNHNHDHHCHHHGDGTKKGMTIALLITTSILLLEFFGGLITNSIALLSDSGHMLIDALSLAISLIAIHIASKEHNKMHKIENYAALFNGVTLIVICVIIIVEASKRLFLEPDVQSGLMMVIAVIGLLANLISAVVLTKKSDVKNNLNARGAYLHIIGDMLGSVGVIIAGLLIYLFDWKIADPIASIIFALIILKGAITLTANSIKTLIRG